MPPAGSGPNVDSVKPDRGLVVPGQPVTWTISLSNQTGSDISAPSVEIDLPDGLNLSGSPAAGGWACANTGSTGPTAITCSDPQDWPAPSQLTITVPTTAASPVGTATVEATAQPGGSSNSGNTDIVASTTAQIAAHVAPDASPPSGAQVTITDAITYGNADAQSAFLNFNGPGSGLLIDQASADHAFVCNIGSASVNCNANTVPGGTTVTLTVVATVTAASGTFLPINVSGGASNVANGPGTNIDLDVGGVTLSGRVTVNDNPYSGTPISDVCVNANVYSTGTGEGSSSTDSAGDFQLAVPANTTYRLEYGDCNQPPTYAQLYYQNTPDYSAATPVVAGTASIGGLDARLTAGHVLSGTVLDDLAQPVSGVQISIQDPNSGDTISGGNTAPDGTWTSWAPVEPGSYIVQFHPPTTSLSDQWWDHQSTQQSATILTLGPGTSPVANIDADLSPPVSISGIVGADNTGIGGLCVDAYSGSNPLGNSDPISSTQSAPDGSYTLSGLPNTASVKVLVRDCRSQPTLGYGFYSASSSPTASFDAATSVTGPATGIDVFLNGGSSISGRVTDAKTGQPLSQVCAAAIDLSTGVPIVLTSINPDGTFTIGGLAPGTYYAAAGDCGDGNRGAGTYPLEWYDGSYGIPFDPNGPIDPVGDHALAVQVAAGATVTGINFRLGTPPDSVVDPPASPVPGFPATSAGDAPTPNSGPPSLAWTGANILGLVVIGLTLIAAGALLLLARSRRRAY